jgi:hypothetical protein
MVRCGWRGRGWSPSIARSRGRREEPLWNLIGDEKHDGEELTIDGG